MSWIATGVRVSGSMPRASARSRARSEAYCSMSAVTRARAPDTDGSDESAYSSTGAGVPPSRRARTASVPGLPCDQPHEGLLEARGPGARTDRRRAAAREHGAVSDHHHLVAERADLLHHVTREQHAVPVIAERCEQTPERQH